MCAKLSYQIINTSAVSLLLLLVSKIHKKENISVGGSDQRRDALF